MQSTSELLNALENVFPLICILNQSVELPVVSGRPAFLVKRDKVTLGMKSHLQRCCTEFYPFKNGYGT